MTLLKRFFSIDLVIYAAIVVITVLAMIRCLIPLNASSARLRRGTKIIITENKQKKEVRSWKDLGFLGDRLQSVWADFLQNAEVRMAHGENCDVSEFINDETVLETAGSPGLADITPGLLTSLGILGTFLGLVKGLSGLSISAASTEQLLAAMEQLIGGMSTAFLTSIAGVTCSVLFTILHNHAREKCQRSIDRFCEVFGLYAMPKPVTQETEMLTMAREQTAYMRQATDEIGERLSANLEASIMRAMAPMQRSMDNFILASTKAQVEGMDRITQVFVQRMNVALGNEFDHLRQVLAETGREQARVQQEMQAATDAIARVTQDVINMHQMSQGILEHFKSYVDEMNRTHSESDQVLMQTAAMMDQMNRSVQMQASVIEKMQAAQGTLDRNQQQYIATTERFLGAAQEQTRNFSREIERVGEQMARSTDQMCRASSEVGQKTADNLTRTTALLDENVTSSIRQLDETLGKMRDVSEKIPQLMTQSRDRYAQQVDQFVDALTRLQKSMNALEKAVAAMAGPEKE
ncbi:MAG: MotA/TolQ/ExbB proton channel family protein [Clostridia bacterium]|nr:MotA/TolQ/ExbB proton channel family protein [Clostridia bacterium]